VRNKTRSSIEFAEAAEEPRRDAQPTLPGGLVVYR
jgi:hypothetical protein